MTLAKDELRNLQNRLVHDSSQPIKSALFMFAYLVWSPIARFPHNGILSAKLPEIFRVPKAALSFEKNP